MLWQKPGGVVEAVIQPGGSVLAVATDCLFPFSDIPDMIAQHQPGTITWAATRHSYAGMDEYRGMDVLASKAIIGRGDQSIIRAPLTLIDVEIAKPFTRANPSQGEGESLYFDVLKRVEQENLRRITIGQKSILNAYFLNGPVVDFGSPKRLFQLRSQFKGVQHATNK